MFLTLCLQQRRLDPSHAAVWQPVRQVSYQLGCSCHWIYSQPPWYVFANNRGCWFEALDFFSLLCSQSRTFCPQNSVSPLLSNNLHFTLLRVYIYPGRSNLWSVCSLFYVTPKTKKTSHKETNNNRKKGISRSGLNLWPFKCLQTFSKASRLPFSCGELPFWKPILDGSSLWGLPCFCWCLSFEVILCFIIRFATAGKRVPGNIQSVRIPSYTFYGLQLFLLL